MASRLESCVDEAIRFKKKHPKSDSLDAAFFAVQIGGGVEFGGDRWPELLEAVREKIDGIRPGKTTEDKEG